MKTVCLVSLLSLLMTFSTLVKAQSEDYDGFCYACIYNNYTYCTSDNRCINNSTSSCSSSGYSLTQTTGCPSASTCQFGVNGYGYFGSGDNQTGTYENSGAAAFTVPAGQPCVAAIVNTNNNNYNLRVIGD